MKRTRLLSVTFLGSMAAALIDTYFSGQIHSIETILLAALMIAWAIDGDK